MSNKAIRNLYFDNFEKAPNFGRAVHILDGRNLKKTRHSINVQCITRIYRYVGAPVMYYIKNDIQIKNSKIP